MKLLQNEVIDEQDTQETDAETKDAVVRSLMENYESIYDIDLNTGTYKCYHQSSAYQKLKLSSHGESFFTEVTAGIESAVYHTDRSYVHLMMQKKAMVEGLEKEPHYSFVYRLMMAGKPVYHKARAVMETIDGERHILMGIRNVDKAFRRDLEQARELDAFAQKEKNHLEAILASAAGYIEANLTANRLLEISNESLGFPDSDGLRIPIHSGDLYSDFHSWLSDHMIAENRTKFQEIGSIPHLIECFRKGEKRASASFSIRTAQGSLQPCREVFYLYQNKTSEDIMVFAVVYDLTEEQRREKERQELEDALQMSRIRNFTSQMQPHFLYNALGSIQEVILENPAYASDLLGDFTTHMRSCIRAIRNDDPIPFVQELSNIRAYVNIEKMRFGDKLNVEYEIGTTGFSVVPLTIQPLVENAIRHGIYERGPKGGTVWVRTWETEEEWIIEVEDNGVGFDQQKLISDGESTGLENLRFRLDKIMSGTVTIDSEVDKGSKICVYLPKQK